ncbi:unnamed protein product, partial [Gulo gulo]
MAHPLQAGAAGRGKHSQTTVLASSPLTPELSQSSCEGEVPQVLGNRLQGWGSKQDLGRGEDPFLFRQQSPTPPPQLLKENEKGFL